MFPRPEFFNRGEGAILVYVAGASAVTQFRHVIVDVGILVLFVWIHLEITGMAASACGLVSGKWPGDYLCVCGVAVSACEIVTMLARVTGRTVQERVRQPGCSTVATVAIQACSEVPQILTWRSHPIVTTLAVIGDTRVAECRRQPGNCRVTDIAVGRGRDVVAGLALLLHIVVAALAVTGDTCMGEGCGQPRDRRVAGIAV